MDYTQAQKDATRDFIIKAESVEDFVEIYEILTRLFTVALFNKIKVREESAMTLMSFMKETADAKGISFDEIQKHAKIF